MKHRELTDHIKGSFLKRQYLEAFLVQSAYIESLLKLFADYKFFGAANINASNNSKILAATRENIGRMGFNDVIIFLHKAELISKEQQKLLNDYRERRNKMMHDLVREIKKESFDIELESICKKGNVIIEHEDFIEMANLLDYLEKPKKVLK